MATIQEVLREEMGNLVKDIRENLHRLGRNASGRTSRSLTIKMFGNDRAELWGAGHYNILERGRRGGKVPYGFRDIIRQWILDKGIQVKPIPAKTGRAKKSANERGLDTMAGAIAYTIMKKGTRLHRMKQFDDIYTTAIERATKRIDNRMPITVESEIESINTGFAKER